MKSLQIRRFFSFVPFIVIIASILVGVAFFAVLQINPCQFILGEQSSWKTVTNKTGNFCIKYPPDLVVDSNDMFSSIYYPLPYAKQEYGGVKFIDITVLQNTTADNTNVENLPFAFIKGVPAMRIHEEKPVELYYEGLRLYKRLPDAKINNASAFVLVAKKEDWDTTNRIFYIFTQENQTYVLYGYYQDEQSEVFRKSLETFHLFPKGKINTH